MGLRRWLSGKDSPIRAGDVGSIPGLGRSLGGGNGNPLQYSCLGNFMDRTAWWASVQEATKSRTRQSDGAHTQSGAWTTWGQDHVHPAQGAWHTAQAVWAEWRHWNNWGGKCPANNEGPRDDRSLPLLGRGFLCIHRTLRSFSSWDKPPRPLQFTRPHRVTFSPVSSSFEIRKIPPPWGRFCWNPAMQAAFPEDGAGPRRRSLGEHNGQAPYVILM